MTLSQALLILDTCDWLKMSRTSVSASRWSNELGEKDWDVHCRRLKGQSFEDMVIRAATMALAGHKPKPTHAPLTTRDACKCGSQDRLSWHRQLKTWVCVRCSLLWEHAGREHQAGTRRAN